MIKDKNPETIVNRLHEAWCLNVGFSTVRFWEDNRGKFRNARMEDFANKLAWTS